MTMLAERQKYGRELARRRREHGRQYVRERLALWVANGGHGHPLTEVDFDRLVALTLGVVRIPETLDELADAVISAWLFGELDFDESTTGTVKE